MDLLCLAAEWHIVGGELLAFSGAVLKKGKNGLKFKKTLRVVMIAAVVLAAVLSIGFAMNKAAGGSIFNWLRPMSMNNVDREPHFAGTVIQVYDNAILVSVNEGGDAHMSSDLISVSLNVKLKESLTDFMVGDEVIVYYNGEIAESYPAQVLTVYAIVFAPGSTSSGKRITMDSLHALSAMRTPYVGNNGAVGKIIGVLPKIDNVHMQRFFSIGDDYGTGHAPYTLTLYYEPYDAETADKKTISVILENSALLFSLIDNLEEINYAFRSTPGNSELDKGAYISSVSYCREDIAEYLGTIGLRWDDFENDWNGSVEKMFAAYIRDVLEIYYLENPTEKQKSERLLSVTLYSDGTANLSTPLISSYMLPNCTYAFIDEELLIYANIETEELEFACGVKNGDVIAWFAVADENTLVFKSASVPLFADEGARYISGQNTFPVSAYSPREWLNYFDNDNMPWGKSFDLELPEYPDTIFRWTFEKVVAITSAGEKELFEGMPVWSVYLADLTGDGLPELCATISNGSGIVDNRVVAYDYSSQNLYVLSDRMKYDYALLLVDGRLVVTKTEYGTGAGVTVGELVVVDGGLAVSDITKGE